MKDKKMNIIEAYRKELAEIHPALPAYFCANIGYIIPWPKNDETIVQRYQLERVDPNGEVDDEVLDELIRIWASESWFGLAVHPPLAFILLKRYLTDPKSKLSKFLYKNSFPSEVAEQNKKSQSAEEVLKSFINTPTESENKTEAKTRSKRKV